MARNPKIRTSSPVDGLGRGRLSFVQVLAQSVSAVAPSAVMVTLPALVIPGAGRATIAVFVAAAVLMALVGYCVAQFATRMVAVSGLYSYIAKGLGPRTGFAGGWSLVIGYASAAMASVLGAASYSTALLGRVGVPASTTTVAVAAVVVGCLALALMVRGVQVSSRITLAVEAFAIVVASAVLIVAFAQSWGAERSARVLDDPPWTSSTVGFALLIAITSYVGFESATTVARESRNPLTAVPRAVKWTPLVLGALYVGAAYLQLAGPVRQGDSLAIVLYLPPEAAGVSGEVSSALSVLMELGILASWLACVMGSTTALSRTLFAMGREGVLPARLGRTHRRFQTPHIALLTAVPFVVAVPIAYLWISGSPHDVLMGLLAVSAHGYVIAYILVCIATPAFLRKIGELSTAPIIFGIATATVMAALIIWSALSRTFFAGAATAAYVALMVVGATIFLVRVSRFPARLENVGVYDEPVADDLLMTYQPWEVRR
ncbi:APC family permease [Mycolicibacterium sp.]|uniref:APC family permease n=1 Tax=Mycolicibacterium sp. TaxID=2320850 RepID=UPI0025F9442F|nr:APC family permease [Mycolicibacterium sp.]